MSLLKALIVKNSHILAGIYFIFEKKHPRPNMKDFQHQIWTSRVTKIVKQIKSKGVWGKLEARNCFQRQTLVFM